MSRSIKPALFSELCLLAVVIIVTLIFYASARAAPLIAAPQLDAMTANQLPRADDATGAQTGVPDFELETVRGTKLRLSSLRGRVVLLDFFSATCPHCQKHAPFIVDLAKRYHDKGLVVVNLSSNNQFIDGEKVAAYMQAAGIENEVVWSPLELFKLYIAPNKEGVVGVPYVVLFGADGRAVARFASFEDADRPAIEGAIQKAMTNSR